MGFMGSEEPFSYNDRWGNLLKLNEKLVSIYIPHLQSKRPRDIPCSWFSTAEGRKESSKVMLTSIVSLSFPAATGLIRLACS